MDETGSQPRSIEHIGNAGRFREPDGVDRKRDGGDWTQPHLPHVRRQRSQKDRPRIGANRRVESRMSVEKRFQGRMRRLIHGDETLIEAGIRGCGHALEEPIEGSMAIRGSGAQQLSQ